MSFKIHLLIVCLIILTVYAVWQWTGSTSAPVASPPAQVKESNRWISVIHASWGLNCRGVANSFGSSYDPYKAESAPGKLRVDNVLVAVSNLCNGQEECTIPVTADALDGDPAPACADKQLTVEYRCFSYDRPWTVHATNKSLSIDCSRPSAP